MSDLHVGASGMLERLELVVANLIFECGDRAADYVIVITGDLVDSASRAAYDLVLPQLERLRNAGFRHILVVPGNHDYGTGELGDPAFVGQFKEAFFGQQIPYPKIDIIDDIAFIGLDSMAEELNPDDKRWAQGELGPAQLGRLEHQLCNGLAACRRRVVYLHHHPFDGYLLHQLKDSDDLRIVLERAAAAGSAVDAVLYGHNHVGKAHYSKWGIPRCYDAGTTTLKSRNELLEMFPWFKPRAVTRDMDLENAVPEIDRVLFLL